jgi:hypothetical protein
MSGLRYADESRREQEFLDMTSLTVEEFRQLVPSFEEAFQERMKEYRLDGKKRSGRGFTTYSNCPLPTSEDRLLFILVYLKTNALQVAHGRLFGIPQNKANQWIHTLLPVLQTTLRRLGDAPARSMEQLAERLALNTMTVEPDEPDASHDESALGGSEEQSRDASPLFAMTVLSDVSNAPKMRINRKAIIAARKNVIP